TIAPHQHATLFPYTTLFRSELRQIDGETVYFEYHYDLNGEGYSGEVIVKAVKTDDPSLSYWAMPLGHVNGIYQLKVWDKLPMLRSEEHTSELQSRFDLVCRL